MQVLNVGQNQIAGKLELSGLPSLGALIANDNAISGLKGASSSQRFSLPRKNTSPSVTDCVGNSFSHLLGALHLVRFSPTDNHAIRQPKGIAEDCILPCSANNSSTIHTTPPPRGVAPSLACRPQAPQNLPQARRGLQMWEV